MGPGALVHAAAGGGGGQEALRIGPVGLADLNEAEEGGRSTTARAVALVTTCTLIFPTGQLVENASGAALLPFGVFVAQEASEDGAVAPVQLECDDGVARTWPLVPSNATTGGGSGGAPSARPTLVVV
jgi:hypothetical protein